MAYQTVADATFDEDSTSGAPSTKGLVIAPKYRGSTLTIVTADTDQQTVHVQIEQGSKGSGVWKTVKVFTNVNFTYSLENKDNSRVKIIAKADAGGASTATWTESVIQVDAVNGQDGKPIFTVNSFEKDALDAPAISKSIHRSIGPAVIETASFTVDPEKHGERVVGIDGSAGAVTVTMPSSTGSGKRYEFVLTADPGNNDIVFSCDADGGGFSGFAVVTTDNSGPVLFGSDNANDLITLNNTTTGGLYAGDRIILVDAATNFWHAEVYVVSSGAEATPFSGS